MFEPAFMFLIVLGVILSYVIASMKSLNLTFFETEGADQTFTALYVMFLLATIITIFIGATEVPRDINTRTITLYLSKPITRSEYLLGKFIGTFGLTSCFFLTWLTSYTIFSLIKDPDSFSLITFLTLYIYTFSLTPLTAIAITVSTYLDDIAAMITTFMILAVSFSMFSVSYIVESFPNTAGKAILLFYYFVPNLSYLFTKFHDAPQLIAYLVYCGSITAIILKIGLIKFNERDLI